MHLWSSSSRCLPQKWPLQKLQSPAMRCGCSLQSWKVHRTFLGAIFRGQLGDLIRAVGCKLGFDGRETRRLLSCCRGWEGFAKQKRQSLERTVMEGSEL